LSPRRHRRAEGGQGISEVGGLRPEVCQHVRVEPMGPVETASPRHSTCSPLTRRSHRRTVLAGRCRSRAMRRYPRPPWPAAPRRRLRWRRLAVASTMLAGAPASPARPAARSAGLNHEVGSVELADTTPSRVRPGSQRTVTTGTGKPICGQVAYGLVDVDNDDHADGPSHERSALPITSLKPRGQLALRSARPDRPQKNAGEPAAVAASTRRRRGVNLGRAVQASCSRWRRTRAPRRVPHQMLTGNDDRGPYVFIRRVAQHQRPARVRGHACLRNVFDLPFPSIDGSDGRSALPRTACDRQASGRMSQAIPRLVP
jgi:hypothetical protein